MLASRLATRLESSLARPAAAIDEALAIAQTMLSRDSTGTRHRHGEESIDVLRAGLNIRRETVTSAMGAQRPSNDVDAEFSTNKIVSMLRLHEWAYGQSDISNENAKTIAALSEKMLDAGLPGATSAAPTTVINCWLRMRQSLLKDGTPAERETAIAQLARYASRLVPYRETKSFLLTKIPESTLADCSPAAKARLVEALFRPLDVNSRYAYIEGLIAEKHFVKATLCIDAMAADLQQALDGSRTLLRSRLLSGNTSAGRSALDAISPDELVKLQVRLADVSATLRTASTQPADAAEPRSNVAVDSTLGKSRPQRRVD